jgi:hypothetical protein
MNTISYEGVVFTRGAIRLQRAAGKSRRRFARANHARPDKRKFILSPCFKGNAREFPDGGGNVDAGPCPDNLLGSE